MNKEIKELNEKAVRKEFATYNPKPHKRYVSLRNKECSNNNIERFHGTFRQSNERIQRKPKTIRDKFSNIS